MSYLDKVVAIGTLLVISFTGALVSENEILIGFFITAFTVSGVGLVGLMFSCIFGE